MRQVFTYKGTSITFQGGDADVMVNATEMIKAFPEKRINNFLRNEQTESFVELLESKTLKSVLAVNHGGRNPGTWMHQKLALKFAAWLSPDFELWVYDRIDELVRHGATAINPEDLLNPDVLIHLATALKEERAQKEAYRRQSEEQARQLLASAPKIEYYEEVLNSNSLITATELAGELGFRSAKSTNLFLKQKGIIRKVNGAWVMCAKYAGQGFAKYKTHAYTDTQGKEQTHRLLCFTEKGRKFLTDLIRSTRNS